MDMEMEDGELKRTPIRGESFSLSDEDADLLEIKPPQTYIHRHKKSKHSSSSKHKLSESGHRKKHHHSRSHRERGHHSHREKKEEFSIIAQSSKSVSHHERHREHDRHHRIVRTDELLRLTTQEEQHQVRISKDESRRTVTKEEQQLRAVLRKRNEEKARELERDLRDRLEKRRQESTAPLTKEKEKEKEERDLRRHRLMEAERVKETYKKDIEERRARREKRERSRSRERKLVAERAEAQEEMERAGLVILTDEDSDTPLIKEDYKSPNEDKEKSYDDEETYNRSNRSSSRDKDKDRRNGSYSSSRDSTSAEESDSSSTETDDSRRHRSDSDHGSTPDSRRRRSRSPKSSNDRRTPQRRTPTKREIDNTTPHREIKLKMTADDEGIEGKKSDNEKQEEQPQLPPYLPAIQGCRNVEEFHHLNRIEEGTYGVVYRARDKRTNEIVALKRLKMEKEKEGFPITSLREINTLLKAQHPNIVVVREIVVGSNMDKIFIVMEYVEHDLKSLMETMKQKKKGFSIGEVKCLMSQLLSAVAHLHDNWILHRDLKTSNLLLSYQGILKVGDFGLAREYGSPLKPYTSIVVTLWYRAPELLLGIKEYSTPIDMWSVGCIFAELLLMEPLFTGKSEIDQLNKIFKALGTPNDRIWPGYSKLPAVQKMTFTEFPVNSLRGKFSQILSELGLTLLNGFLTYNPLDRLTAVLALQHEYFNEAPQAIDPAMFPSWPAKSELGTRKKIPSPKPPSGGQNYKQLEDTDEGFHIGQVNKNRIALAPGFSLKF